MKVIDAIGRLDDAKPNTYTQEQKIDWLSKLDLMIKKHIIETHEGGDGITFNGYDHDSDTDTELLAPPPFDELYVRWLEAQVDFANGEYNKYNASIALFNTEWRAYEDYYHRTHMPKAVSDNRFKF